MYKVTIEGDDLKEPVVLEYERVAFDLDRGFNTVYTHGATRPAAVRPNGQSRACIKLWSGCLNYDAFIAEGMVWE